MKSVRLKDVKPEIHLPREADLQGLLKAYTVENEAILARLPHLSPLNVSGMNPPVEDEFRV